MTSGQYESGDRSDDTRDDDRARYEYDNGGRQGGRRKAVSPTDVQKALKGIKYPASRRDLLKGAERAQADGEVIELLERIADCDYGTPASVSKAIGKIT